MVIAQDIVQLIRRGVTRAKMAGRTPAQVQLGKVEWAAFERVIAGLAKVPHAGTTGARFDGLRVVEQAPLESIALLRLSPVLGCVFEIDLYEPEPDFFATGGEPWLI